MVYLCMDTGLTCFSLEVAQTLALWLRTWTGRGMTLNNILYHSRLNITRKSQQKWLVLSYFFQRGALQAFVEVNVAIYTYSSWGLRLRCWKARVCYYTNHELQIQKTIDPHLCTKRFVWIPWWKVNFANNPLFWVPVRVYQENFYLNTFWKKSPLFLRF